MISGRWSERIQAHWLAVSRIAGISAFTSGSIIGILLISTWLTWTLTWSDDRAFASASIVMLALGLAIGGRYSLSRFLNPSELSVAACTWALVQPWLQSGLSWLPGYLPAALFTDELLRTAVGLAFSVPTWLVSGWLWSSLAAAVIEAGSSRGWNRTAVSAALTLGIAAGIGLCTFVLAPVIGTWCSVAAVAVVAMLAKLVVNEDPGIASPSQLTPARITLPMTLSDGRTVLIQAATALVAGGLLAVLMRLMAQLMPDTAQVRSAEWIGLATGFGVGTWLMSKSKTDTTLTPWLTLAPAVTSAAFLAALPMIIAAALWATTGLTSVALLIAFRTLLLIAATAPVGSCLAGISGSSRLQAFGAPYSPAVACGFIGAQVFSQGHGLVEMLALCCSTLTVLGVISLFFLELKRPSRLAGCGLSFCALIGLSVPLWSGHHHPSQTAKLLFSTPTFVAHRAGWESRLLPMLDDARVISTSEGTRGPLTLWRSHGLQLHLRENGIPLAVISADVQSYPQFAPEVLQAVFPLVLAQNPGRVLLLGAAGGVPLSTCLQFPVQKVVCAESDIRLVEVIRGPIAQETGEDPFADERVQLISVPPAVAVMSNRDEFDVILSSSPSAAVLAGGACFTADHYQQTSRCLAAGGIFCQRLECVDFGPGPLRMILQSMRQAFREVLAIETSAGELLLLGTNTADVFIPGDLPVRLEAPHIRRVLETCGLDWSALLNYPAYDNSAIGEICAEGHAWSNSHGNGILAFTAPLEVMRWGAKLQEVQKILTAARSTPAPFLDEKTISKLAEDGSRLSRKSRMLDWLGEDRVSPELLRRLSEVVTQHKLVSENPETHWWEYRKALRQQLQDHPRSKVQQVSHSVGEVQLHVEDEHRKQYFVTLGAAAKQPSPSAEHINAVLEFLQPYDPLLSYFARQEIADLHARGHVDPATELALRLHVIYFAPVADGSTRNVATAIELLVKEPGAIPDAAHRFDILNGLVQTLRSRWELRQTYSVKSPRRQLSDIDRSIVAIEKAIESMAPLHAVAQLSDSDWESRQQVIDRMLLRPLRAYRGQLQAAATRNEGHTQSVIDTATTGDTDQ